MRRPPDRRLNPGTRKRIIDHPSPSEATPAPARNFRLGTGGRAFDRGATIAAAARLGAGQQQPRGDFEDIAVTSTTIHKAKGGEADAVLITFANTKAFRQFLTAWRDNTTDTSETLRVYYVAVTRARRLIGFTYPYSCHAEMVKHLRKPEHRVQIGARVRGARTGATATSAPADQPGWRQY